MKKIILTISFIFLPTLSHSLIGPGHVSGKITNITSIKTGLLLRIEANEVPESCTSGQAWMEIKQTDTTLISMTLTAWTLGRSVDVYTSPASSGYCQVWQLDPSET